MSQIQSDQDSDPGKGLNIPSFRLLGKDIFVYGVMGALSRSIALLLLPIFTHQFSAGEYGVIEIVATLSSLLTVFISMSLDSAVSRFWFEKKKEGIAKKYISSVLCIVLLTGSLFLFLIWVFSPPIAALFLEDSQLSSYIIYGAMASLFGALSETPKMVLRMERKVFRYNLLAIVQTFLYAVLALLLIFWAGLGLKSVFISMVVANALAFGTGLFFISNFIGFTISVRVIRSSLAFSLPLVPAVLVTWVNKQSDRIILLAFLGLGVVGVFGASARIALAIGLLTSIFRLAWSPYAMSVIEDVKNRNQFYKRAFDYYAGIMLSLGLILVAFSKDILILLSPEEYHYGYVVIPWLIAAKILHASGSLTNLGMVISKKTGGNSIAAIIGAVVNVSLAIFLIPLIGIWGAAIGSFFAELIFTSMLWYFTTREVEINYDHKKMSLLLLCYVIASSLVIVTYTFMDLSIESYIIRIVILFFSIWFVVFNSFSKRDLVMIKKAVNIKSNMKLF